MLGGVFSGVLDELGHHGESKAIGQHEFGFQYRVVVNRLAVMRSGQTGGAMSLGEREPPGTVHGNHEISLQETIAIQHLLPNQGSGHIGDRFLHLIRV